jgi:hypothetical protein
MVVTSQTSSSPNWPVTVRESFLDRPFAGVTALSSSFVQGDLSHQQPTYDHEVRPQFSDGFLELRLVRLV